MSVRIGKHEFDDLSYDGEADVLYLSKGEPAAAATSGETPEGHVVRLDADGQVIGVTLISPRLLLASQGSIVVTFPDAVATDAQEIAAAIGAAR